jgi:hypothetical protein
LTIQPPPPKSSVSCCSYTCVYDSGRRQVWVCVCGKRFELGGQR